MRKDLLLLGLAIGFVSGQNGTVEQEEAKAFSYEYGLRELDNGLTVLAVRTEFPNVVSLNIPVQVGSRNEVDQGLSGFAHFFEHMMFRGTDNYTSEEFFTFYKSIGAAINAFTTADYTSYYATLPSRDNLEDALILEADRFRYINYSEEDFKTEAGAILGEYNLRCQSNVGCALLETQRNITFDVHPYKHEVIGFLDDIKDMPNQFEYSKLFFDRYYHPEKTCLVIVGDIDINETVALVEKHWGGWERGNFTESIPQEPPGQGPVYEHVATEISTLPIVTVAFRGPAYSDTVNDMATMGVAFYLTFSSQSPLYQKLVLKEQKVSELGTLIPDSKDPFLVTAYAYIFDVQDIWYVRDEILKTFADLRVNGVSSQSVADTVSFLRYDTVNGLDSSVNIASKVSHLLPFHNIKFLDFFLAEQLLYSTVGGPHGFDARS
jgi:zinc protease